MIKSIICFVIWMIVWAIASGVHYLFAGYLPGYKEAIFALVGWGYAVFMSGFLGDNKNNV